jgi:hypothetical protein
LIQYTVEIPSNYEMAMLKLRLEDRVSKDPRKEGRAAGGITWGVHRQD